MNVQLVDLEHAISLQTSMKAMRPTQWGKCSGKVIKAKKAQIWNSIKFRGIRCFSQFQRTNGGCVGGDGGGTRDMYVKKGVKESGKFNFVSVGLYPRDLYVGKRSRVSWSGAEWWRGRHAKEEKKKGNKKKYNNWKHSFHFQHDDVNVSFISSLSPLSLSSEYKTVKNIYSSTTARDEKFHIRFLRLHDLSPILLGWELTLN